MTPHVQALVVGASSAIGTAVATELARLGYDLSLWGRDSARLGSCARACADAGRVGWTDVVDVTDRQALAAAAGRVEERGPLTALVWAAGLFDFGPADAADVDAWDRLLDVNLASAAVTTRLLLPALLAAAPSALVYVGSVAARQVFADNAAYVASKHGLAGLAGAVFLDVRQRGVKVSLISPGLVAAGAGLRSPAGSERPDRLLQPADVASAVRFVVTFPVRGCPTELVLQPQADPASTEGWASGRPSRAHETSRPHESGLIKGSYALHPAHPVWVPTDTGTRPGRWRTTMTKLMSAVTLGVTGLVTTGLIAMQSPAAGAEGYAKREDDSVELVLMDDDDDGDTNDDTRSRDTGPSMSTNDNTNSRKSKVSRDRDNSRGDKTKDWTRDGGTRTRDRTGGSTNDKSRHDTRG